MSEYLQVARHLGMVRRAWKRAAALSGAAIVAIESMGVLTVALLVDWIYQPLPGVRVGLLALVITVVAVLLVRHVIRPLMKKISDDQLAMFVEEHSEEFEGALITAAELHGKESQTETPQAIVDAVMRAALARANRTNVRRIVDWGRLKKYGMAAVLVVAGYGVVCLAFPDTIGKHASRVIKPWQKTKEDFRFRTADGRILLPVEFRLSKGDTRILRRDTFDLQAALSRASNEPVLINFRPAGQESQPWRVVPMKEIDKVNTFSGALADVDEDLEFYVSTGSDRSGIYKVGVYDPLRLLGFELKTQFPEYLKLADKVEIAPSGELMAPIGSKIKMRILTNTPVASAKLAWQDGRPQPMTIENGEKGSAVATIDVAQDTTYSYEIVDANGQKETSPVAMSVRALPDRPPTLEMKYPTGVVSSSPMGEVTFAAEAVDDLALASVELVYQRQLPMTAAGDMPPITAPARLPLLLSRAPVGKDGTGPVFPDVAQATLQFAMEDLQPAAAPEEIISYYLECRDRKGHVVQSDIQMIVIDRVDAWPQFDPKPPHGPTFKIIKNITEYLQAAWKLEQQRGALKPEEYVAQSKALAATMIDPETKRMYPFYERKKVPPEKIAHADRVDRFLESGYQALVQADTSKAVADFRIVLAELTILKLDKMGVEMFTGDYGKKGAPQDFEKDLKKLFAAVQIEVDKVQPPPNWDPKEAKTAEKIKKAAEDLAKEQQNIVKKAEEIAQANGTPEKPKENQPAGAKNEDKDKDRARAQAEKDAKALANEQDKVAARTQKEAMTDPKESHDPEVRAMTERLNDAAQTMREASKNLKENKTEQAVADAKRAAMELKRVAERIEAQRQEKIAAAVADAENRATKLLIEQKDLTKDTQALAKDPKANDPQKESEYKKLTYRQAQLQAKTERFKKDVEEIKNAAERDAKLETVKHLQDTHKELNKSEPDQKMVNAVVELGGKRAAEATKEQAKAEAGLEKVIKVLRKADESLAADRESQLARAKEEARRVEEGLTKLGAATRPATPPATTQTATTQKSNDPKVATTQKANTEVAVAATPTENRTPGTEKNSETQPTAKNNEKDPPKQGDPAKLTPEEKKAIAEDVAIDLDRLARHVADRDFAEKPDQEKLKGVATSGTLTRDIEDDKDKRNEIANLVRRVRDKLEAEYQVTLDAKRLADAQREDCPPAYRLLVNRYYEALSEAAK